MVGSSNLSSSCSRSNKTALSTTFHIFSLFKIEHMKKICSIIWISEHRPLYLNLVLMTGLSSFCLLCDQISMCKSFRQSRCATELKLLCKPRCEFPEAVFSPLLVYIEWKWIWGKHSSVLIPCMCDDTLTSLRPRGPTACKVSNCHRS